MGISTGLRRVAAAAAVALASALVVAPAMSQTSHFPDHDGGGPTAVQRVVVTNDAHMLWVRVEHSSRMVQDKFWIDSRRGDPGPEYRVWLWSQDPCGYPTRRCLDFGPLERVDSFSGRGQTWHCPQAVLHSDNREQGAWNWIGIPQRCIRGPGAVRIHVESNNLMINDGGTTDQAPNGPFTFTHWVRYA